MKETIILSAWTFLAISIITGMVIHMRQVIPTMQKYGRNIAWSALPWDQFKQWSEYKRICVANRLSLKYWRILIASQVAGGVGLAAWIVILLMYR